MKNRTVATRVNLVDLAKAYDALLARGIPADKLTTTSQILKTCILLTIANGPNPKDPPSPDSLAFFKQLWGQTKMTKNIQLGDLYEK